MYVKRKYIIIAVIVLLTIIGILAMQKMYKQQLAVKDKEISNLETEIARMGEMTIVYRTVTDVKAGNECSEIELEAIEAPGLGMSENAVTDAEHIIGQYYKIDLKAGTQLTNDMFIDYELEDDMRYMDVVFDEIPIGLAAGDYIDVRISFPLGQDYIALSHKRVAEINGDTVKLIVGQRDFYCYESMKTDIATFPSTKIYGAEYVEAGTQQAATTYYPINLDVLLTMLKDPNINTGNYSKVMALREQLEEQLLNSDKVDISQKVTSGRLSISEKFDSAQKEYERLQSEKEKQAAREAQAAQAAQAESDNSTTNE